MQDDETRIKNAKRRVKHVLEIMGKEIKEQTLENIWNNRNQEPRVVAKILEENRTAVSQIDGTVEFLDKELTEENKLELAIYQKILLAAIDAASIVEPETD